MQLESYMYKNAATSVGYVVLSDGHHVELDTPDGVLVQSYNLDKIFGTSEDIYSVEAIEPEFLIARQYAFGDPFIVNRKTQQAVSLYELLFAPDTAAEILQRKPEYFNNRLTYSGRIGSVLHFNWGNTEKSETLNWELSY